jgi:hypothetical protein
VFSLKTTELKCSWIGIGLWLFVVVAYVALLQIYWMPAFWRALLYLSIGLGGLVLLIRMFRQPSRQISIDEQGAFLFDRGCYERLLFIRANGVQLIAKVDQGQTFLDRNWSKYRVIYRDSVPGNQYKILRSYAAQQILLHRSEEAKKRFSSKA